MPSAEQGGEEDPNREGGRESPTGLQAAASGAPAAPEDEDDLPDVEELEGASDANAAEDAGREAGAFLKPCVLCKARRKGVNHCIRMGHAAAAPKEVLNWPPGKDEVKAKHVRVTFTHSVVPPGRGSTPEPDNGWGRKYRRGRGGGLGAAASGAPAAHGEKRRFVATWPEEEVQLLRSALQSAQWEGLAQTRALRRLQWPSVLARTLVSAGFRARTANAVLRKCESEGLYDKSGMRSEEAPVELRTCKYCQKVYATVSSRSAHQGQCSQRPKPRTADAPEGGPLRVGDHVEALYRDGLWYGAVIAELRDRVATGPRASGESREGGAELEPGISGADAGFDVGMGGGGEYATVGGQDGGEEAAAGAGDGGVGIGCGVTFVVTWDDGDQEDRVKTESQARAFRTRTPPPRASTRRAQLGQREWALGCVHQGAGMSAAR